MGLGQSFNHLEIPLLFLFFIGGIHEIWDGLFSVVTTSKKVVENVKLVFIEIQFHMWVISAIHDNAHVRLPVIDHLCTNVHL